MKCTVKIAILALAGFARCAVVLADNSDSYATISARNIFGLVPQEVIVVPPPPAAPLPKITLDGFMTVFGRPQVLFKVAMPKTPPGNNLAESFFVMGEGEREYDIKVVQIDLTTETVAFLNRGTLQQISLTDRK
jgi:hypothetical protein